MSGLTIACGEMVHSTISATNETIGTKSALTEKIRRGVQTLPYRYNVTAQPRRRRLPHNLTGPHPFFIVAVPFPHYCLTIRNPNHFLEISFELASGSRV
ncbi:hypothetical protein KOR42_13140 [Thalassoglobus neptunius]|uniref:Uncharacterized protein n=1 Tax=Thalassoglobus neptunius TaxID=1938619 RepID=A0A5C5X4L5_9PLAN|nr:hypothetical protein KOR42_13140 [Thalassoglobus neptunius]